jgi:DNA segregation ATPase FtsK/SpoIIIE, S-DNA-T family
MSLSLTRKQWGELRGILLLLVTLLLALAYVPLGAFGFGAGRWLDWLAAFTRAFFGVATLLLPVLPFIWSLDQLGRMQRGTVVRWSVLTGGLLLVVPAFVYLVAPLAVRADAAGWVGGIAAPLARGLGWIGALLVVVFVFAALAVVTLGWNPLRTLVSTAAEGGRGLRSAGRSLERLLPRRDAPAAVTGPGGAAVAVPPVPAPTPGPETGEEEPEELLEPAPAARRRGGRKREPEAAPLAIAHDSGDPGAEGLPPTTLLQEPPARSAASDRASIEAQGRALIEKLATFKIEGEVVGMTSGPVVTQFEVSPAPGVKISRISALEADLALAMRAPSVRILAPIPGKAAVGVEVPNPQPEMVYFREVLESAAFRTSRALLPLALGKEIDGAPYVTDLAKMPHLLIAGATGSGKSVCINTIITSLVYRHTPRTLRLLMVDPKMVELSMYNDLPHLRHPVVTDNNDAAGVLKWAVMEMERRYALLSVNGVRNLQDFNRREEEGVTLRTPQADGEEGDPDRWIYRDGPLPYIVVIVDELADLMMTVSGDVEKPLALLAQKARAIGIHLILATQRPSVNVITGLIKANFPSRIAFRVSSKIDSRTILDQNGADALLGNGDLLFLPPGRSDPLRAQGAFLSTEETERLMGWYREQARLRRESEAAHEERAREEEDILEAVKAWDGDDDAEGEELGDHDALFHDAARLCIQHQGGSTSLLQRRLRIGYGRAARIVDQLHQAGVLGAPDGSKPREVLVDLIQLEQMYPED